MDTVIEMTPSEYKALEDRLAYLKGEKMDEVASQLKFARSLGDLSENAEYHAAKDNETKLHDEIDLINYQMTIAKVMDKPTDGTIGLGSKVKVYDEDFEEEVVYEIVGTLGVDIENNKISNKSPTGNALMGKKVGDKAVVATQRGSFEYKVLEVIND